MSKSRNLPNFDTIKNGPNFLTPDARMTFNYLWLAFTKALILQYFDLECHIWIETDALSYAISGVLSQLAFEIRLDWVVTKIDLSQWHSVVFFLKKMIPAKTQYETHDGELLAIVKAFKIWHYYLESCKYKLLVLTNHNILHHFINTKSFSSRQVRWAQKLS